MQVYADLPFFAFMACATVVVACLRWRVSFVSCWGPLSPHVRAKTANRQVFMDFLHETCSVEPQAHRLCPEGAGSLDRGGGKATPQRETAPVLNKA